MRPARLVLLPLWAAGVTARHHRHHQPHDGLYDANSPVLAFDDEELAITLASGSFALVEFYAAWCGHCQHYAPTYEDVARLAHEKLPQLTVAAINCPSHETACSQHGVHEFPTLIIFPGTGPSLKITQRDRSAAAVVAWAAHHAPDSSSLSQAPSDWARDAPEEAPTARVGPQLRPRRATQPVPVQDILAAARYGLMHEVPAALEAEFNVSALPDAQHEMNKRGHEVRMLDSAAEINHRHVYTALVAWLRALSEGLPREVDGGAARAATRELSERLLRRRHGTLGPSDWREMLDAVGVAEWPDEHVMCSSSRPELHAYPCSLWLLFHTLLAHAKAPRLLWLLLLWLLLSWLLLLWLAAHPHVTRAREGGPCDAHVVRDHQLRQSFLRMPRLRRALPSDRRGDSL